MDQKEVDIEVINAIKGGDSDRYRELVDRYKDYVYTITLRILTDSNDAEEASQDTFMKAFKNLKRNLNSPRGCTGLPSIQQLVTLVRSGFLLQTLMELKSANLKQQEIHWRQMTAVITLSRR